MAKHDDDNTIKDRPGNGVDLAERPETQTKKPSMWNVIFINDNFTPMDFVVFVLKKIFHKSEQDAGILMMAVHIEGKAVIGTYTHEVAETKQILTMDLARLEQHPLLVELEKVE